MLNRIRFAIVAATLAVSSPAWATAPLVQYLINEAASGTAATTINDTATGTAANLTCHYAGAGARNSITAGDGRTYSGTSGDSDYSATLSGTKVQTALNGATNVTLEIVADSTTSTTFGYGAGLSNNSSFNSIVQCNFNGGATTIECDVNGSTVWTWTAFPTGVHVFTLVIDTTQVTGSLRQLGYIDGVLQTATSTAPPTQNTAIDAGEGTWTQNQIAIGGIANTGASPSKFYYMAIYAAALGSVEVASNATALASNNDAAPGGGAAPPTNAFWFASRPWEWSTPPCIARGDTVLRAAIEVVESPVVRWELPQAFAPTPFRECVL